VRFSIRDLIVLITVLAVGLAVLVPAMLRNRDRMRSSMCRNNLKQLGLALHNYHSTYLSLPSAMSGTMSNAGRVSGLSSLLPFVEQQALWERISHAGRRDPNFPDMGPVPWDKSFTPWLTEVSTYRCPVDTTKKTLFGLTNYTFSLGDCAVGIHANTPQVQTRGAFAPRRFTRFHHFLDGTSHTIAMAELATARGRRVRGQFAIQLPKTYLLKPSECLQVVDARYPSDYASDRKLSDLGRGGNWAHGAAGYALVQTILPPNQPSCAISGNEAVDGFYSASSRHPRGCHVLFADGAVHFVTNSIDTGDLNAPPPTKVSGKSPYGVWGALGSRAGSEGDVGYDYP
jgi:prepilin-type processing-associated H-X9-DG protein